MDEKDLKKQLEAFPSSFDFERKHLKRQKVKEIIKRLKTDAATSKKSKEEEIKINNFLSYLSFLLENVDGALSYCNKSLELDTENLTANVNKCHFLLKIDDIHGARTVMGDLKRLKKKEDFKKRECYAKADLAYAYSRSGPWYHEKAEELYNDIIPSHEDEYEWKFGLGLVLVRQTHLLNSLKKNILKSEGEKIAKALKLFIDADNSTSPLLRGLAWVEIGEALYHGKNLRYNPNMHIPDNPCNYNPKKCFEKALSICPEEPFVLERSGKHYRYFGDLEKSEKYLRQALTSRESCYAYHHLALTLNSKAIRRQNNQPQGNYALKNALKSPSKVEVLPGNRNLLEAEDCLKKALEISIGEPVLYDLALVYRRLDQPEKALETLNKITMQQRITLSGFGLANVYEQKGMCLFDLAEKSSSKEKAKLNENGKEMLYKTIELQARLAKDQKLPENGWSSYSKLIDCLETDPDPNAKGKLAEIHNKMNNPMRAIALLQELREQRKGELSTEQTKELATSYAANDDFNKALMLLEVLRRNEADLVSEEKEWFVDTYVNGALMSIEEDLTMTRSRFRSAYDIVNLSKQQDDNLNEENAAEIHIVHGCTYRDDCQSPKTLYNILVTYTDLKVTINAEDSIGKFVYSAMQSTMENSRHILILVQSKHDPLAEYYFNQALKVSESRGKLVLAADEKSDVPTILDAPNIPKINLPNKGFCCADNQPLQLDLDEKIVILKNFFKALCST